MSFKVFLHPRAARSLEKLDAPIRVRIKQHLLELEEYPDRKGERLMPSPFWRLRVGDYRVIYEIDRAAERVVILFVGHRSNVYDDFSRLF